MKSSVKRLHAVRAKLQGLVHDSAMLPGKVHAVIFTLSLGLSTHAMAAGVTGFFTGWKGAINALIELLLLGGMLVGIGACLYGVMNLIKKGMNRGEDIEWSKVTWPIIGGALATVLLFLIQAVVEEGGASKSDMGRNR